LDGSTDVFVLKTFKIYFEKEFGSAASKLFWGQCWNNRSKLSQDYSCISCSLFSLTWSLTVFVFLKCVMSSMQDTFSTFGSIFRSSQQYPSLTHISCPCAQLQHWDLLQV